MKAFELKSGRLRKSADILPITSFGHRVRVLRRGHLHAYECFSTMLISHVMVDQCRRSPELAPVVLEGVARGTSSCQWHSALMRASKPSGGGVPPRLRSGWSPEQLDHLRRRLSGHVYRDVSDSRMSSSCTGVANGRRVRGTPPSPDACRPSGSALQLYEVGITVSGSSTP